MPMAIEEKFIKVAEDDPNRCQGIMRKGGDQCMYRAEPGTKFCPKHKGMSDTTEKRKKLRNYQLTRFRAQIERKADSSEIKSLREEIGITRQVLESIINLCESEADLVIQSNRISELVSRVDRLVTSCHKLEKSTGQLLDKTALIQFAGYVIEIICDYTNPDQQAEISRKLIEAINNVRLVGNGDE